MGAIAKVGKFGICHKCGEKAILNGHGKCASCYDIEVDMWIPPIPKTPIHNEEWRIRNKVWQKKYYETHKAQCIKRTVECHRRKVIAHPELLIKNRDQKRKYAEANRHPCLDCGKPCAKTSTRCRFCYYKLLRSHNNPWRQHKLLLSHSPIALDQWIMPPTAKGINYVW